MPSSRASIRRLPGLTAGVVAVSSAGAACAAATCWRSTRQFGGQRALGGHPIELVAQVVQLMLRQLAGQRLLAHLEK